MDDKRPDSEQLLPQLQAHAARAHRGHLTIFFGASAGVGKTYTMLEAAQRRRHDGVEVVVGCVEPHGRPETERLLIGLEALAPLTIDLGGRLFREFDLDGALERRPALLLVDELAHTNITGGTPSPRHQKRWQEVEELLDAGVDVYTTVNVQQLESLSDVVAQITGIRPPETLPDRMFDQADEVKLVDLPPDDLLQRLREGRVYVPQQAQGAFENFFRKGNLIALRELALRKTADRVDQAMRDYRTEQAVRSAWAARDRLLVAVGADAQAERLVRAGKRLADGLNAEWLVVFVETPDLLRLSEAERNRHIGILRLAASLGAEPITLGGSSATTELLEYARTRNVTRILVGVPNRPRWRRVLRPSTTEQLLAASGEIDVLVIGGHGSRRRAPGAGPRESSLAPSPSTKRRWPLYLMVLLVTLAASALCWLMRAAFPRLGEVNLIMVYLLTTALIAVYRGRRAAVLSAVLGVAAFDYLFVQPRYSFAVGDAQYLLTFAIMLTVALIIGTLNASVRLQARVAGHRERRTALLYAMTRQLSVTTGRDALAEVAVRHVSEVFTSRAALLFPDEQGHIAPTHAGPSEQLYADPDVSVAQWVFDHGKPAGLGTDTLAAASGLYLPVSGTRGVFGVLALRPEHARRVTLPEQFRLLETFATQIGVALERAEFAAYAQAAEVRAESEAIRNALLASISQDLRTPLSTIAGGAAMLAGNLDQVSTADRRALATSVAEEAGRVSERITTLLDLVRLETGAIQPQLEPHALDELVGTVLHRLEPRLRGHELQVELPEELPLAQMDARLIEQVLENLLDNAIHYTPAGSHIWVRATALERLLEVSVEDDGPGLGGDPEILFEKFQRGHPEGAIGGIGLGLAICRTILRLHRTRIWAENRAPHGAAFRFTLPIAADTNRAGAPPASGVTSAALETDAAAG